MMGMWDGVLAQGPGVHTSRVPVVVACSYEHMGYGIPRT
jgi:hypothetical protein